MSKKITKTNWFYGGFEKAIIDIIDNICYNKNLYYYEIHTTKVIKVCASIYAHEFVTISNYDEDHKNSELNALYGILKDLVIIYYKDKKGHSISNVILYFEEMIDIVNSGYYNKSNLSSELNAIGVSLEEVNRMIKFIRNYSYYRKMAIDELKNSIDM